MEEGKIKRKSPAFQFYPEAYLSDINTTIMTPEQEGHYIRLLCFCWLEGSIPSQVDEIKRLLKEVSTPVEQTLEPVLKCFKKDPKNKTKLTHKRLELERSKQQKRSEQCSSAGKKSAQVKKKKGVKDSTSVQQTFNGENISRSTNDQPSVSGSVSVSISDSNKRSASSEAREKIRKKYDDFVHDLIVKWETAFENHNGESPEMTYEKDYKIMERLTSKHGVKKCADRISRHIILEKMQSITGFKVMFNDLGKTKPLKSFKERAEEEQSRLEKEWAKGEGE